MLLVRDRVQLLFKNKVIGEGLVLAEGVCLHAILVNSVLYSVSACREPYVYSAEDDERH